MEKIAFISTINGLGGSELLWRNTAEHALNEGYSVFISVADRNDIRKSLIEICDKGAEISYRPVNSVSSGMVGKAVNHISRRLFHRNDYRKLVKFNPDIIVISGDATGAWFMPDLLDILRRLNTPYIHISHGGGGFFSRDVMNIGREYFRNAAKNCFVANRSKQYVEMSIAKKIDNGLIVRNPVNMKDISIVPFSGFENGMQLACVSRINLYTKCLHHLLEALSEPEVKEREWVLNIFGDGEHLYVLEELIRFFGLQSRVLLKGHADDIRKIWKENHFYLMPSCTESAPISLVEAMMCGRPALVTNVGGVSEWIEDGQQGFISETANPWLLKPALLRAFDMKENWEMMGKEAHSKAISLIGMPENDLLKVMKNVANGV